MADQSPGAEVPESPHDQGKPAEDAGGSAPWSDVTGVTGEVLVVEPGDAVVILCGLSAAGREDLGNRLKAAMPDVRVEVHYLWSGGATLLYRPTRVRARTDADPAPPACTPDLNRVTGWRCAPELAGQVHGHHYPPHATANRLAWQVQEATGAFTPVCAWCLHPAAGHVPCSCTCHRTAETDPVDAERPRRAPITEGNRRALDALRRAGRQHGVLDWPERGGEGVRIVADAETLYPVTPVTELPREPAIPVPERVDELPPLGDVGHDQAADQ